MGELLQLLEHLVINGPARNPGELDRLLGLIEQARQKFDAGQVPQAAPPGAPAATTQGAAPAPSTITYTQLPGGAL